MPILNITKNKAITLKNFQRIQDALDYIVDNQDKITVDKIEHVVVTVCNQVTNREKKHKRISKEERKLIHACCELNFSVRLIAKILKRHHKSISDEIKNNSSWINQKAVKLKTEKLFWLKKSFIRFMNSCMNIVIKNGH